MGHRRTERKMKRAFDHKRSKGNSHKINGFSFHHIICLICYHRKHIMKCENFQKKCYHLIKRKMGSYFEIWYLHRIIKKVIKTYDGASAYQLLEL